MAIEVLRAPGVVKCLKCKRTGGVGGVTPRRVPPSILVRGFRMQTRRDLSVRTEGCVRKSWNRSSSRDGQTVCRAESSRRSNCVAQLCPGWQPMPILCSGFNSADHPVGGSMHGWCSRSEGASFTRRHWRSLSIVKKRFGVVRRFQSFGQLPGGISYGSLAGTRPAPSQPWVGRDRLRPVLAIRAPDTSAADIQSKRAALLFDAVARRAQIDPFVLHGPPRALEENVVVAAPASIHVELDTVIRGILVNSPPVNCAP
jgi:hypothetical protein